MKAVPGAGSQRAVIWWRRLIVMTRKEMLQLFRDVPIVAFLVYSFTLAIYITGNGIRSQLHEANLLVHDADHSISSRELIHRFQAPFFRLNGQVLDSREGLRRLDRGTAVAFLEIPPRFHEQLMTGEPTAVQLLVDTTNSANGLSVASYAGRIVARFGQESAFDRGGSFGDSSPDLPLITSDHRVWYNPDQNEAWFECISHLLRQITIFALLLPAAALVREKERGTVEQLLVSPLSPFQIMASKVLAMTLVILGATAVGLFGVMQPVFGVPIKGNIWLFFTLTALFVVTTAGMGLAAATLARNQGQVGMMTLLVAAPMLMLSGITAPMEAMPASVRAVMALSPLRYFIDIANGILLKGTGLNILWDSVLAMAALGASLFGFGLWRFRRQFQ
ncbi:MAG: yhhJ [Nitrospira sp.]|jgi:ABC-2 type transport system permease protein|nr:yhhJ [Nitrospira sp.]MCE3224777.1 yhhJ [Nitrospira sp.]